MMRIVPCEESRHAAAILEIFNEAILNSTAIYDYQPRTMETMAAWFAAKAKGNFPVIGLEDESGDLMGFGSYGTFRTFPAYKYSVEHSIYVNHRFRRRGVAKVILQQLIVTAESQNYHLLIGGIDSTNQASIALHEKFGFAHCGTIQQAGFKFGRWLDLSFYQLTLTTPAHPIDG